MHYLTIEVHIKVEAIVYKTNHYQLYSAIRLVLRLLPTLTTVIYLSACIYILSFKNGDLSIYVDLYNNMRFSELIRLFDLCLRNTYLIIMLSRGGS